MNIDLKNKLLKKIVFVLILGSFSPSQAVPPNENGDDTGDKTIKKTGHYVVDTGRAEKISNYLIQGRNVEIKADGNITFARGIHIHGNGGKLKIECTGCVDLRGSCFSTKGQISIQGKQVIANGGKLEAEFVEINTK